MGPSREFVQEVRPILHARAAHFRRVLAERLKVAKKPYPSSPANQSDVRTLESDFFQDALGDASSRNSSSGLEHWG